MPTNEEIQTQLSALNLEVHALRDEVERLKGGASAPAPKAAPAEIFEDIVRKAKAPEPPAKAPLRPAPSPSIAPAPKPARDYASAFTRSEERRVGKECRL